MKELNCTKCGIFLGEIVSGKIKKDAIILCKDCFDSYKTLESLHDYEKGVKNNSEKDFGNIFNDLMKGKMK